MDEMKKFIKITTKASNFMKKSIAEEGCFGVRIDVAPGGCQGLTYEFSFVKEINSSDLVLEEDGVTIYIAAHVVPFISGMTVDFISSPMGGNIVFENPNAKSRCGCGKSFCMDTDATCDRECCF
ncbi:MAG: iron-sulfur cluster assembly accessory protein [Holosporaceae bacterium]|jgi:iron-sulfur cluster assembly protein|nr:iron-sulfur cluster assembly accessory protein [Holosporaceae bacterium]